MAAAEAAKEAMWLKSLLSQLGIDQPDIFIECGDLGIFALSKYELLHPRTKHIDIRYNFLKIVDREHIFLQKIHTSENASDMLRKALPAEKFRHCLDIIHIIQR